jgi:hypothetical protein
MQTIVCIECWGWFFTDFFRSPLVFRVIVWCLHFLRTDFLQAWPLSVGPVPAILAAWSARSFPGTHSCAGINEMAIFDEVVRVSPTLSND